MVEFNQTGDDPGRIYLQGFGGDTSNAIIAACRQGAKCAYVTRLGNDDFGRMCLDLWRTEGVVTGAIGIDATTHTGIYFVRHDERGHSFSYLPAGSAAAACSPPTCPSSSSRTPATCMCPASARPSARRPPRTVLHAMRVARHAGAQVSYDPNLRLKLWPLEQVRDVILASMALCDQSLPSLDDVQPVSGLIEPGEIVAWCHRRGGEDGGLEAGPAGVAAVGRTALRAGGCPHRAGHRRHGRGRLFRRFLPRPPGQGCRCTDSGAMGKCRRGTRHDRLWRGRTAAEARADHSSGRRRISAEADDLTLTCTARRR